MQSFSISRLRRCKESHSSSRSSPRRQGISPTACSSDSATLTRSRGPRHQESSAARDPAPPAPARDTNGSRRRPAAATVTRSRRRPPPPLPAGSPPPPAWEFTTLPSAESADSEC
ncbi:hypothetical protein CK203_018893 [Vitis vinifera]|uniref:Uncharacterized protein n=1 Tax=Vitis vinifera TaxID=29760 RepID=A0A438IQQ2_VITVI|nr:hypothetical protein CK203_018893 [Vitis vinifera]